MNGPSVGASGGTSKPPEGAVAFPPKRRRYRFPKVAGGCRVRSCVYMRHACPRPLHRLLNVWRVR